MRVQNGVGLLERQKGRRAGGWSEHYGGRRLVVLLYCWSFGGASFRIALELFGHVGGLGLHGGGPV